MTGTYTFGNSPTVYGNIKVRAEKLIGEAIVEGCHKVK